MKTTIKVLSILFVLLLAFGCSKQATEPQAETNLLAVNTGKVGLSKVCNLDFGPLDFQLGDYSAVWPASDSNLVIWYFGGQIGEDGFPQDFISGNAWLPLDSLEVDMLANVTLRKRGADAASANPLLAVHKDVAGGVLLAELLAGEEFSTFSFEVPAGTTNLYFVFGAGDIDFSVSHADVNFDISHVSLYIPE